MRNSAVLLIVKNNQKQTNKQTNTLLLKCTFHVECIVVVFLASDTFEPHECHPECFFSS